MIGRFRLRAFGLWPRLSAIAQLVLSAMWLWSSAIKWMRLEEFQSTIREHGLAPEWAVTHAYLIPASEVILGVTLAVTGARRPWGAVSVVVSLASVVALTAYLIAVPSGRLAQSGCGCAMGLPVEPVGTHGALVARIAVIAAVHLLAMPPSPRPSQRPSS